MDDLLPVEPVRPPSPRRRRLLAVVTLVVVAVFVVVAGLGGSGFILRPGPGPELAPTTAPIPPAGLAVVGLDGGLSVINGSGGAVLRVPAAGAAFQFPAWSPDGTRIATIRTDSAGTGLDIFAIPAADGGGASPAPTTVYASTDQPVFYLYWAPDSLALGFLTTEPDGIALRRAPADGSGAASVIRNGAPMYWQWIDPARLLVHSGAGTDGAFAGEIGLDGTPAAGPGTIDNGSFRVPALSTDGRYVGFSDLGADGTPAVVVATRDGSSRHEVPVVGASAFEFAPGGDALAFTSSTEANAGADLPIGPLRLMDAATGAVRTLLDGSVVTFFWAPDGRTIAAVSVPGPGDTKVASAGAGPATLARANPDASETAAEVALRVTFVDAADGTVRSVHDVRLSDLFINQVLPFFDQYALSHRFWSPDSRSVVLPIVNDEGVSRISRLFADGSDPVDLGDGQFASWSP